MKLLSYLLFAAVLISCSTQKEYRMLVGTYTRNTDSKGIYSLLVNPAKKTYEIQDTRSGVENPGFLAISGDNVYAVGEGSQSGSINAFKLDKNKGKLNFINSLVADGKGPCSVTATKSHVIIANYGSGNINVFSLHTDGSLNRAVQNIQHVGSSVNKERQKGPHAHQVIFDPKGNYLFSNNLGNDLVYAYRYRADKKEPLELVDTLLAELGGGPRHLTTNADGSLLYVLQELTGTISIVGFANEKLTLIGQTTLVTKPGKSGAADIHLSPDGNFLYATNRIDYNDISVFSLKSPSKPELIAQYSTEGSTPRNFMITRDGRYLFVGNQRSDTIVVFKRSIRNGKLEDTGMRIPVPAPVCHIEY